MLQNLNIQFSSITRCVFCSGKGSRLQTETCSVMFGIFRDCGTVFYRVRYGAVRCIHLVIPPYTGERRRRFKQATGQLAPLRFAPW